LKGLLREEMIVADVIVNLRKESLESSEVVSQALFAEKVTVLEKKGDWSLVQTPDGYQGWGYNLSLVKDYHPTHRVCRLFAHVYRNASIKFGPICTLPFGVGIEVIDDSEWAQIRFPRGEIYYIQRENLSLPKILSKQEIVTLSRQFLHVPYTWGGRSSFGFDCSGFVQMLYAQMGVLLPRDAREQILVLQKTEKLAIGDLIFWGEQNKIQHVGMYLGENRFIHSSSREKMPWLRISTLTDSSWNQDDVYPLRQNYTDLQKEVVEIQD